MKEKKEIFTDERKTGDLQNISGVLLPLAKKLVGKKAFAEADVICNWTNIAGKDIFAEGVDLIIPVPLHYTRLIKRRYNQSALLAKELGKLTGIEVDYKSLVKGRITKAQIDCNGTERLKNVKDAFYVKSIENIKGKRVLIIDDVLTTGSTLKECGKALKDAKPKSIYALTLARSIC